MDPIEFGLKHADLVKAQKGCEVRPLQNPSKDELVALLKDGWIIHMRVNVNGRTGFLTLEGDEVSVEMFDEKLNDELRRLLGRDCQDEGFK